MRFSCFAAKSCSTEIVVAWPLAQFSSCTDPTAWRDILFSHSHHGGVSRSCSSAESLKPNSLRTICIVSLVWCIAVHTTNRGMGACGALLAGWKGTQILMGVVGAGTNSTTGVVSAEGSRVSIGLPVVALRAPSICDVVIQLAFSVADNEILTTNASLFDVTCKCHHNCRIGLICALFGSSQPPWCLALDKLRVVSGNTVRNFRQGEMSWNTMQQKLAKLCSNLHLLTLSIVGEGIGNNRGVILIHQQKNGKLKYIAFFTGET